jgi:alkylation response protein AidB-like acyl-CoA dehydrogenase
MMRFDLSPEQQPKETARRFAAEATIATSCAKAFGGDQAMRITTHAVQIFGGYGYMKGDPIERPMRDAKLRQIYGTSQVQRIARNLLKG